MCSHRRYPSVLVAAAVLLAAGLSTAPAEIIVASTFDTSDEGWSVYTTLGYSGPVNYESSGGNPGGYIWAADPDTGAWAFRAPAKFEGGKADAYGGKLTFDIASNNPESDTAWVGIEGNGLQLVCQYDAPDLPNVVYNRSVTLVAATGWVHAITQQPASESDLITALSNLTGLVIVAEFAEGTGNLDVSALDNVILTPEPATLVLLALGGLAALKRRKR